MFLKNESACLFDELPVSIAEKELAALLLSF